MPRGKQSGIAYGQKNIGNSIDWVRFHDKIRLDVNNGCWLWQASKTRDGYGVFWFEGKNMRSHRFSYMMYVGLIDIGLELDHKCRVRNCVNPQHLEPVTCKENIRRGNTGHGNHAKGKDSGNGKKTECLSGHIFNNENTYIRKDGRRDCRICNMLRGRKHHAKG